MTCMLAFLVMALIRATLLLVSVHGVFEDQFDRSEFPIIPDCQDKHVNLILISDASTEDYTAQLQLLVQVVDMLASDQEHPEHLKVAMAVSGCDSQDKPNITWLFELGTFIEIYDVKEAIMLDKGRPKSKKSFLRGAIDQAERALDRSETTGTDENGLREIKHSVKDTLPEFEGSTVHGGNVVEVRKNNSRSDDENITLILALANPDRDSHYAADSDLQSLHSKKKLLVVFIFSDIDEKKKIPCSMLVSSPCLNLLLDTMLEDHSLGLALCDRCFHGWFGPMPSPAMSSNHSQKVAESYPAMAYKSCYRIVPTSHPENYALRAAEKCTKFGASLVSIESEIEHTYLTKELNQRCLVDFECPGNATFIFIGLQRNMDSLGKRFRWLNGRPLLFNQWVEDFPRGGSVQGCSIWALGIGWVDLGCGQRIRSVFSLCEWTKLVKPNLLKVPQLVPLNESSTIRAFSRGQIGICGVSGIEKDSNKFFTMAMHFLIHSTECTLYVNNTGKVQKLAMPLFREWLFPCNEKLSVQFSQLCDQIQDCTNIKDEKMCPTLSHLAKEVFTCVTSKKKVDVTSRCDLYTDCIDGSDEENCKTCKFGLCADGRCVPQPWLIDEEKDCMSLYGIMDTDTDTSIDAELDCAFLCNISKCVPWRKLGDGIVDCLGPEGPIDETLGALERADCGDALSAEWAPKCVYQRDRLGELIGCRYMRHLQDCEEFVCPEGYIKCPLAYCIPVHYLHNGITDCPMGEDEAELINKPGIIFGYFKCGTSDDVFVHPDRICDGSTDCLNGSDEEGCHVTCTEGFLCVGGFVVVDGYDRSEPLTSLSFIDPKTRMVDLSGVNVSSILPTISDLELNYLFDLRLSNSSLADLLVPLKVFNRLSKLDISYNLLCNITQDIPNRMTLYNGAPYLQYLNLSYNAQLEFIDTKTFDVNSELRVLDLSNTALTTFPNMTGLSYNLLHLNLSHTRIKRISAFTFPFGRNVWRLEKLDLRGVDIVAVEPDAFSGLQITSDLHCDFFNLCCPQLRGQGIPEHACHAPSDPLSSCTNLLENKLLRILVWVMGVCSMLGNIGVIVSHLISRKTIKRKSYTRLVTQLGISDLLMGIYLLIIASKDVQFQGEFVWHDTDWRHSDLCRAAGFLSTLSSEVSSIFILLITVDRYLVIKYPFGQHRLNPRCIILCSVAVWVLGFVLAAIPLLPGLRHWDTYSSNAVCLGLPLIAERRAGWQYSTAVFILLNFLLCLCISVGQLAIYKAASSTRRAAPTNDSSYNSDNLVEELSPRMKQDLGLARRLAAVAFTDLLCWVPIGVIGLLAYGGNSLGGEAYAWVAIFVLPINSALNPVLYSLPVIRHHLIKTITKCIATSRRHMPRLHDRINAT